MSENAPVFNEGEKAKIVSFNDNEWSLVTVEERHAPFYRVRTQQGIALDVHERVLAKPVAKSPTTAMPSTNLVYNDLELERAARDEAKTAIVPAAPATASETAN